VTPGSSRYLRPETLRRIHHLRLRARDVVAGTIAGLQRSPYKGQSVEFRQHREYVRGDDLRRVDWKVWGRQDRLYVKEHEEETNLKAYLLLDASGSMGYGSAGLTKFRYGCLTAAALSHLMLRQRDAVGLVLFDAGIRRYIPPRSVTTHLHTLLREIEAAQAGADTDLSRAFHDLAERIRRRGLIVVISDFTPTEDCDSLSKRREHVDRVISGLRHFRHRKHEVVVFHLLDPKEMDLAFDRETRFVGLERGAEVATEPWHIAGEYRRVMREEIDRYRRECREGMIDYVPVNTAEPFDTVLFNYLAKRKKLG